MSLIKCNLSISLDGFVAGPNQSQENPIGEGGMRLHEWMFATAAWRGQEGQEGGERSADSDVGAEMSDNVGAYVMGRNMFAGPGAWDETWRGWWGEEPPYHAPVFVITHHQRKPLPMQGGTTFHFVTSGIDPALEQARAAAKGKDVLVAGGASVARQCLAAGLLDELYLHISPVILGAGERLLDDVGQPKLEIIKVVASPGVTHIKYALSR